MIDLLPCPFCGSSNVDPEGWASTEAREALEKARDFIDPDRDPPRMTNRELVALINAALTRPQRGGAVSGTERAPLATDPKLLALIEAAKNHVMTPDEIYEQRRSFTRGMCPSNRDYAEWCEQVDRLLPPLSRPNR